MPATILTIPCLSDNYAFLMHDDDSGETALIDAPEAAPITAALKEHGWSLTHILLTHHHWDHVEAVETLRQEHNVKVVGAHADAHRLPALDVALTPGDQLTIAGQTGEVIDVSGHTVGHIAFHFPGAQAVFTGDSLMALGCGRLFEGTPEQMWDSLSRLSALPDETIVYSGHEYTAANAKFAATIEPENANLAARTQEIAKARDKGEPTVPSALALEKATNPFLRAHLSAVKSTLGMSGASDSAVFAEIRSRKDSF